MKKVFALLFVAGVLAFACTKKEESTTVVDTTADTTVVSGDTIVAPMDTTMADTTAK